MKLIFLQVVFPLAQQIEETIRQTELPFKMDEITIGDGNCFTRAVLQQCQRNPEEQTVEFCKLHGVKDECVSVHVEREQCSNGERVQSEV